MRTDLASVHVHFRIIETYIFLQMFWAWLSLDYKEKMAFLTPQTALSASQLAFQISSGEESGRGIYTSVYKRFRQDPAPEV